MHLKVDRHGGLRLPAALRSDTSMREFSADGEQINKSLKPKSFFFSLSFFFQLKRERSGQREREKNTSLKRSSSLAVM